MSVKEEDIFNVEMVNVHTLERHTLKYNKARHKIVITPAEDGSEFVVFEPISGPEEGT